MTQSSTEWPTKEQLATMMEQRELSNLEELGGTSGLMQKLHTSQDGLSSSNLSENERLERF